MFHRRRDRFKFTEKTHSKKGICSLCVALGLLILFFLFLILSYQSEGNLSMYYGSAGVFALVLAVINFIFAIQSLFEENSFQLFPRMAVAFSFLALAGWGAAYIAGFLF